MRPFVVLLSILIPLLSFSQHDCLTTFREISAQARGDYSKATVRLDSLGQLCEEVLFQEKADTLALIYHKKGVYHYLLKEYSNAIASYEKSLAIRLKDPKVDPVLIGHSHLNMAKAYKKLRNYPAAKSHLQTAYDTLIHHSNYKRTGESCHELALVLWELRDFYPALDFAEQAHNFYLKAKVSRSIQKNIAAILLMRGVLHAELAELDEAESYYQQAKTAYQNLDLDFQVAKCWNNLAEILYQKQGYEGAIEAFENGLTSLKKMDYAESAEASQMYSSLGICWMNLGKFDLAEAKLRKALALALEVYSNISHPDVARIFENLGDLALRRSDNEVGGSVANGHYRNAITCLLNKSNRNSSIGNSLLGYVPIIDDSTIISGDRGMLLRLLHSQALAVSKMLGADFHLINDEMVIDHSMAYYKAADQLLFRMRREQLNVNSHLYWVEKGKSLYESAIGFCFKTGKLKEALYFAERSKASILLEGIKSNQLALQSSRYKGMLEKENQLKVEVFAAEQMLADATKSEVPQQSFSQLQNALIQKRIELHRYVESLKDQFPQYFQANFDDAYIQNGLDPQYLGLSILGKPKTVIQFFEGQKQSYVFLLQESESWMDTVSWEHEELKRFVQLIQNPSNAYSREGLAEYQQLGQELFSDLLGILEGKEIRENLIIIPDGSLQRLPFEALLTESGSHHSYQDLAYMIRRFNCSYAYSLAVLERSWRFKSDKNWGILGIAPVHFPTQNHFASLPKSEDEIKKIVGKWNGKFLLREKATLRNFIKYLNRYKVLHFATHAFASSDGDKPPFIAFADTLLYLPEIYGLQTDAQMVVLSACQTLEGRDYQGEGIMSLTRAFRFIGVPSILASLWQADEQSTQQLMLDYYEGLGEGLKKNEALRKAKLAYIKDGPNAFPFYWANMVHRGNTAPLQTKAERNNLLLLVLAAVIMLALGTLVFRKRNSLLGIR